MLPVVRGDRETTRQIVLYTLVLIAVTLVPSAGHARPRLPRRGARARRRLPLARPGARARADPRAARACSSTTRCSTSRCSSSRWPSTRCPVIEPTPELERKNMLLGLGAVRLLPAALRRHGRVAFLYLGASTDAIFLARPAGRRPASRRGQGSLRHGRPDDDVRLGDLRRPRARGDRRGRRPLEAAGYANVGKTNLHEFAYGTTSREPALRHRAEPASRPGAIAGGSSGGSAAALAAGLADAALGTTRAARSGSRPPAAASSASSRPSASSRSTAASRSRRASTTPGPMARTSPTATG